MKLIKPVSARVAEPENLKTVPVPVLTFYLNTVPVPGHIHAYAALPVSSSF
jgi:hypothetical protein